MDNEQCPVCGQKHERPLGIIEPEKKICECALCRQARRLDKLDKLDMRLSQYKEITREAEQIFIKKTNDYNNSEEDMLSTLNTAATVAGISIEALLIGIIINKQERLTALLTKGRERLVINENAFDTALDNVNYSIFLARAIKNRLDLTDK